MRASRALIAGTAVSLALLVAFPLVIAHVAGAAGARGLGSRAAIVVVDGDGASAMLPDGTGDVALPWLQPGDTGLAVSPSGRRLAFSSARAGNRELYVADIATGVVERLTWTQGREDVEPAWSPDGSRLVWASGTESNHDLQTIGVDRTRVRRLTSGPADDREPSWSPDGRTVAFASNQQGAFDLWTVAAGGAGRSLLIDAPGQARAPDWHPSGARLAYTGLVGAAADVWVGRLDGTTERLVASSGYDGRPDWSPDGRRVGFLRGRGGTLHPWSAKADGTGAVALLPRRDAHELTWGRLDAEVAPSRRVRLPDLDQRAPRDLVVRAAGGRRFVLGFTSATDNLGLGPLWLRARRPTRSHPMLVEQLAQHDGRGVTTLRGVGVLRYERHPPHRHWHLDDFVRYELRSLDGRVAVRDRKSGFCLIDRWGFARRVRGIRPALPRFVGDCATLQPDALRVEQGSSVGYTDRYPAFFHGQDLELTGLPAGRYLLVQTANPERRLREVDYSNNAASLLVRLFWPSGKESAPRIEVLRTCAGSATCAHPPDRRRRARTIRTVEHVDVLVVGAGPAGSSTAIHLARAGARVLLADKARFPRDKPCGGGLTGRALKRIPVDPSPVVERDVDRFELRLRYGRSFTRSHDEPLIRMTQRRRLDAFLAEQAAAAGAELRQGARVESLAADGPGITARVGGVAVRADAVVGADGANGIVARSFGLGDGIVRGVALEGNVPLAALDRDLARTAVIELAVVPGGYGWVFPKGDHANLGVGGWGSEGPALRGHLARLANEHGVDPDSLTEVRGHRLPMRRLGTPAGAGRVLLVGDAAGLVDPLSGDGMYEAFVSARLAADAIVAGDLERYAAGLAGALDRHAAASWAAKRAFDRHPRAVFAAARAPGVFTVVAGLLCGDVAHPADARGVARGPLKLVARLAGSAGYSSASASASSDVA